MEKPSVMLSGFTPFRFVAEVLSELKKVTWPTRAETVKLTGMVVVISVIVALYIGGLDAVFLSLTSLVLK